MQVMSDVVSSSHLENLFNEKTRKKIINRLTKTLKAHTEEFDAIAISGYSMALIVPILAHKLKKEVVIVRKKSEVRHSHLSVEGGMMQRCVFIDDLISSQDTFNYVRQQLGTFGCVIVAAALYHDSWGTGDICVATGEYIPVWDSFYL